MRVQAVTDGGIVATKFCRVDGSRFDCDGVDQVLYSDVANVHSRIEEMLAD